MTTPAMPTRSGLPVLACLGAVLGATAAVARQPAISLAPRFLAGESVSYTLETEFSRRRAEAPDAPGTRVTQSARLSLVTVAERPEGGASVRAMFDRLSVRIDQSAGPASTAWEWTRADDKPSMTGPEVEGLDPAYTALVRTPIVLEVAADGSIRAMDGIEQAHEAIAASMRARAAGDPGTPILGVFSPGAAGSFFEGFWTFNPGKPPPTPAPGDQWRVTKSAPLFGGYEAEATTIYTLNRVRGDVAEISGLMTFAVKPPRIAPDPASPLPRLTAQSGRVEAAWDTAARRLVHRRSERSLAWSSTIALKEPIEARDYTTSRVEVRWEPPTKP